MAEINAKVSEWLATNQPQFLAQIPIPPEPIPPLIPVNNISANAPSITQHRSLKDTQKCLSESYRRTNGSKSPADYKSLILSGFYPNWEYDEIINRVESEFRHLRPFNSEYDPTNRILYCTFERSGCAKSVRSLMLVHLKSVFGTNLMVDPDPNNVLAQCNRENVIPHSVAHNNKPSTQQQPVEQKNVPPSPKVSVLSSKNAQVPRVRDNGSTLMIPLHVMQNTMPPSVSTPPSAAVVPVQHVQGRVQQGATQSAKNVAENNWVQAKPHLHNDPTTRKTILVTPSLTKEVPKQKSPSYVEAQITNSPMQIDESPVRPAHNPFVRQHANEIRTNKDAPRSEAANLIRERPKEKEVTYRVHKLEDRRERSRERQRKNDRYRRSASTGTELRKNRHFSYRREVSISPIRRRDRDDDRRVRRGQNEREQNRYGRNRCNKSPSPERNRRYRDTHDEKERKKPKIVSFFPREASPVRVKPATRWERQENKQNSPDKRKSTPIRFVQHGPTVKCDGPIVKCDGPIVKCDGPTVKCNGPTVKCNGPTVKCDIRLSDQPSNQASSSLSIDNAKIKIHQITGILSKKILTSLPSSKASVIKEDISQQPFVKSAQNDRSQPFILIPTQDGINWTQDDLFANRSLYIGNLPADVTPEEIKRFFNGYKIEEVTMKLKDEMPPSVYAFARFETLNQAMKARVQMHGQRFMARKNIVYVGYAKLHITYRLWLGELPSCATTEELRKLCQIYGFVQQIDYEDGADYAYVRFVGKPSAVLACRALREKKLGDQPISVDFAGDGEVYAPNMQSRKRPSGSDHNDDSPPLQKRREFSTPPTVNVPSQLPSLFDSMNSRRSSDILPTPTPVRTVVHHDISPISPLVIESKNVNGVIDTLEKLNDEFMCSWKGQIIFKKHGYPFRLHRISGHIELLNRHLGNRNSLDVDQRMPLDESLVEKFNGYDPEDLVIMVGLEVEKVAEPLMRYMSNKSVTAVSLIENTAMVYFFRHSSVTSTLIQKFAPRIGLINPNSNTLLVILRKLGKNL